MASDTDIAWAAGLFEGEGFLTRRPVGNRVYLEMGIEMRDLDVLERFAKIIEDSITRAARPNGTKKTAGIRLRERNARNPKHSDVYVWKTVGQTGRHAYELLKRGAIPGTIPGDNLMR